MCTYRRCMSSTTTAGKFRLSGRSWSWCSGWKGRSWKTMHNAFNQGSPSIHICSLQHSSDSVHRWLSADFKRLPSFFQSWSLLLTFGKYCASCIWHHVSHVHTHNIYIDHPVYHVSRVSGRTNGKFRKLFSWLPGERAVCGFCPRWAPSLFLATQRRWEGSQLCCFS